jgi:cysteinyl-tRNA synthetase
MSAKHLGETFDIHGGGIDLVFPHHENEIAQSTACHDQSMSNVWMHNGHLSVDGQKMSKSLGNVIIIQDLIHRIPGQVVRWALLSSHYRQPLDWTSDLVHQSYTSLNRIYTALQSLPNEEWNVSLDAQHMDVGILTALEDDLNTPAVFTRLHELVHTINTTMLEKEKIQFQKTLLHTGRFMGFLKINSEEWFQGSLSSDDISKSEIERYLEKRNAAKIAKNYKRADEIRDFLKSKGIVIKDTPQGQEWQREIF